MTAPSEKAPAGLTHERVGFFTDAVLAIAMTLLAIELPHPGEDEKDISERELLHFLDDNNGQFIAFLVAFAMIWMVWRQHHRLFDQITRVTPRMMTLHMVLLFFAVLVPYSSSIMGTHSTNAVAVGMFALTEAGMLACQALLLVTARRQGLLEEGIDLVRIRRNEIAHWTVAGYFVVTAVAAWWVQQIEYAWMGIPIAVSLALRLFGRKSLS